MNRKELTQRVRVMARMLKAKAPRLLRKHMGELENMLSSPKAPVKEVANAGLIPLVAKHLLSSDRKLAASAVHAIASITYKCSTSVMKAGCVSKLVDLVCDEDGEIARNAIFALSNLAVDFQDKLLSNNALKQILWRLKQLGEPTTKKGWMLWADAMRLITNLVNITDKDDNCTKEMVKKVLKHKGDRQELIRVLKVSLSGKDQVDVVEDALRGILSLAKLHVCKHCGIPQLLDMEIIPLLTLQFAHSCYKIKKLAVDCIQDVVYNSVLDVSKCRPSPIKPLKELMHNPNQELSTCAALVLSNIACEGEQAIEALKAVGLFEAMVSLLLNPHTSTELKTEAAWFVINVCGSGARRHLEEIVELGAVHGLSRWVLKQQKDTKMVEETVAALRSVCDMLLPKPEQIARFQSLESHAVLHKHHFHPQHQEKPSADGKEGSTAATIDMFEVKESSKNQTAEISPVTRNASVCGHKKSNSTDKTRGGNNSGSCRARGGGGGRCEAAAAAAMCTSTPAQGGDSRRSASTASTNCETNGSEIKLQSMLPEDEALDLVSSFVSAAKVLAHFEVSDGVYPSALETLQKIKSVNHAALELLEGPLAGGSKLWLTRLSTTQLEGILTHLTGNLSGNNRIGDAASGDKNNSSQQEQQKEQKEDEKQEKGAEVKTIDGKKVEVPEADNADNASKASPAAATTAATTTTTTTTTATTNTSTATTPTKSTTTDAKQAQTVDLLNTKSLLLATSLKMTAANPASDKEGKAETEEQARLRKEKMVGVMSHAIQSQLQGKLLAHYNQVRRCEREKQLHQQHGQIHWTVDVMHPSNIKQTKLTSNHFDCGELKCHVLLYPWGNPNRPEAHKTHLSVYVAVLDIEKSAPAGRKAAADGSASTSGGGATTAATATGGAAATNPADLGSGGAAGNGGGGAGELAVAPTGTTTTTPTTTTTTATPTTTTANNNNNTGAASGSSSSTTAEGVPGRFKLTIVNQVDPSKSVSKGGQHTFTELASDRGFAQMIPLKELLQVGKGFIVEGKISIRAEITLSVSQGSSVGALSSLPRSRKQNNNRKQNHSNIQQQQQQQQHLRITNTPTTPTLPLGGGGKYPEDEQGVGANSHIHHHLQNGVGGDVAGDDNVIVVPAADRPKSNIRLRPGLKVDCRDEFGMWLEASIISVRPYTQMVHVHYNQWGNKWDQWINTNKDGVGRHCFGNFQTCSGPRPQNNVGETNGGARCPATAEHPHHRHYTHEKLHKSSKVVAASKESKSTDVKGNDNSRKSADQKQKAALKSTIAADTKTAIDPAASTTTTTAPKTISSSSSEYKFGDTVRVYVLKPTPRRWVKGVVDKVRHQQVRVSYEAGESGSKPYQYWFHIDHGEVQPLHDSENVDMKTFQLTPTNEKIIMEWRKQKMQQWESKVGKLASKYPTRERLNLWLDAQCLKARQQLFKKQKAAAEKEGANTGGKTAENDKQARKEGANGGENNYIGRNHGKNSNELEGDRNNSKAVASNNQPVSQKARRRNRKSKDREANNRAHHHQNNMHHRNKHPSNSNGNDCHMCNDDVFKGIDLEKIDFESVALGPDGQATKKEGKNRRKGKANKGRNRPEPLDLPKMMANHRAKTKMLKNLRDRLAKLSKSLARVMVSNQPV